MSSFMIVYVGEPTKFVTFDVIDREIIFKDQDRTIIGRCNLDDFKAVLNKKDEEDLERIEIMTWRPDAKEN